MKEDRQSRWENFKSKFYMGELIDCRILEHKPFGCFVDVGEDFKGLIEIPNFTDGTRMTPDLFPPIGSVLKAKVLDFTDNNFQVRLSARPSDLREKS